MSSSTAPPARELHASGLSPAATIARSSRDQQLAMINFGRAPLVIAWEITRACAFACQHCRADAQHRRDPRELTTREGKQLIDRLAGFGTRPILVLTGGDPMMRPDLFELAAYATQQGLRVSLTPTATALPTRARMRDAREAGVRRIALSVDAPDPEAHDRFRSFRGSFNRTLAAIENVTAEGLPLQINTTVCEWNVGLLDGMVPLLEAWRAVLWAVFFLVPVGRGKTLPMIDAEQHERVLAWLSELRTTVPFDIKTTAAPHYRRVLWARRAPGAGAGFQFADGLDRPLIGRGVNDGNGFMFISHVGEIMPSGFLPVVAGNARRDDPVEVYRNAPLFRALRNPALLKGKCGYCEFRAVCGGSRARAYALTGDYLESDPACSYMPTSAEVRQDAA